MRTKQKLTKVCGQCLSGVGPWLLPGVMKGRALSMQYGSRETLQPHLPHSSTSMSSLGVVEILQQGSPPLLCYVHLVF